MPTPTAADAAPVAGSPAPAAAPTASLIPDAPAAAAAAAAPAAPAASLIPAPPAAPVKPAAPDPNDPNAWVLAEGVLGVGEKPSWLKTEKYKSVADQAAAYPELEKRFGAFKGAPKDGKYEHPKLEGVGVELVAEHPLLSEFQKWAVVNQLNQEGYEQLVGMLAQYEVANVPDMAAIKAQVGENADARITAAAQWGAANLDAQGYALFREATAGPNAAAVFKVMEAVIAKTQQAALPKPGQDNAAVGQGGLESIQALQAARDPITGKRLWDTDPKHRAMVERKYAEHFASQQTG